MWRRDPGDTPDYWRRRLEDYERSLAEGTQRLHRAPPEERLDIVGASITHWMESIQICRNNIELLDGRANYLDRAWVSDCLAAAEGRLEALMREIDAAPEGWARWRAMAKIQGTRKLVRKWKEERAYQTMYWRVGDCLKADDEAQAGILYDEWRRWHGRPDRKDFDGPAWLDPETFDYARRHYPEGYVSAFFAAC